MIKKLIISAVSAVLLCTSIALVSAQGLRTAPLGFCSLSGMSSATSLTTCPNGIPPTANYAAICAYAQGVVWRDDGVPTGTPGSGGQGISAGFCIPYSGNFSAFQAIQQTGGAILGVTFYHVS
jgi:hypothetical protein